MRRERATRPARRRRGRTRAPSPMAALSSRPPSTSPPYAKLQGGQREEQPEEHDRERAGATDGEVEEDLLVDRVDEELCCSRRAPLGHDAHDVEGLKARHET